MTNLPRRAVSVFAFAAAGPGGAAGAPFGRGKSGGVCLGSGNMDPPGVRALGSAKLCKEFLSTCSSKFNCRSTTVLLFLLSKRICNQNIQFEGMVARTTVQQKIGDTKCI